MMKKPWQYDESLQVGTDYLNQKEVDAYDKRMQKLRDVNAEADDIRRCLSLSGNSIVWEIGTGTGECALSLASSVKHVYATDISPAMLEYAVNKAKQRSINNVTFAKGGFLSGFRPDHQVDGVITQLALHHLPDFWKSRALKNIAGSLRSNGRLYLCDVVFPSLKDDYDDYFAAAINGIRAQSDDEIAKQTIQHIRTEFSTLDWILEGMIIRSGLRIAEKNLKGFLSVYVCEK